MRYAWLLLVVILACGDGAPEPVKPNSGGTGTSATGDETCIANSGSSTGLDRLVEFNGWTRNNRSGLYRRSR